MKMVYILDTLDYWTHVSLEAYWRNLVLEAIYASESKDYTSRTSEDSDTETTDQGYSSC